MSATRILYLFFIPLLISCAKDMDADDWKQQKIEEELARINAVSGTYSGVVTSDRIEGGKSFISLDLEPETSSNPGNYKNEQHAGVRIKMNFTTQTTYSVVFHEGTFDAAQGSFLSKTSIKNTYLKISGTVTGNEARGFLSIEGASFELPFHLKRDSLKTPPADLNRNDKAVAQIEKYVSDTALIEKPAGQKVELHLIHPPLSAQDFFLKTFIPKRNIDVLLHFGKVAEGKPVEKNFQSVEWDLESGSLIAVGQGASQGLSLKCRQAMFEDHSLGWKCLYFSNIADRTYELEFKRKPE